MAKEKHIVIKEAALNNNCPECFNQDLTLTFFQKHTYGKFFHKTTNEITNTLQCNTCNTLLYPVSWTDDIERLFNYYQKAAIPKPKSTKATFLFYLIIFVSLALFVAAVYLYFSLPFTY